MVQQSNGRLFRYGEMHVRIRLDAGKWLAATEEMQHQWRKTDWRRQEEMSLSLVVAPLRKALQNTALDAPYLSRGSVP